MLRRDKVKKVILAGICVYTLRLLLRFRKTLKTWKEAKDLATNLPTPPIPEGYKNTLNFLGWLKRCLPKGEEFSPFAVTKYFVSSIQQLHDQYAKDEGLLCIWAVNPKFTPLPLCNIVIWDMDIVRELTSAKMLPKILKASAYACVGALVGDESIVLANHDVWHPQRIVFEKGFTTDYVNKHVPMMRKTAQELIQKFSRLHQKNADADGFLKLDISNEIKKATMDVIGRFAFSYEIGSINGSEEGLFKDFEVALDIIQERARNPLLQATRNILPSKQNKEFNRRLNNIKKVTKDIIHQRTSSGYKGETHDFLDILLEAYVGDGMEDKTTGKKIKFTEEQMYGSMNSIFIGGQDTTSAMLNWTFHLLAKHPEAAEKILDEFRQNDYDMAPEKLENYVYLNAVVTEVLRLYPGVPFLKQATEDITVGNGRYVIPKGVDMLFFPYFQQRDPKNFERPNDFVPERWINPDFSSTKVDLKASLAMISKKEAFYPFALGARNCVGRKLGLVEARIFILEILSAFEMKLPEKAPKDFQDEPYIGITASPKVIELMIKPRA